MSDSGVIKNNNTTTPTPLLAERQLYWGGFGVNWTVGAISTGNLGLPLLATRAELVKFVIVTALVC